MFMLNPFLDNSAHVTDDFCTERRLWETSGFIEAHPFVGKNVLDVGESNYVGGFLSRWLNLSVDNTTGDLNNGMESATLCYDAAFCFEVMEHVMNPLLLLQEIESRLLRGGVLYLSTPVHNRFGFYFNETNHFAEYKEQSLRAVVEYAGFRITAYHQFKSIPFWRGMWQGGGLFHTFLRVSSQRTQILRAVKI
jgi:SAM-dependent methyltransferase